MNIGKIRNISEENGKINIYYYSGVKRELKNIYLRYNLIEYIKRTGTRKGYSLMTLLDIAQSDLKRYYITKNKLYLWKLKNICKANNIEYNIQGVVKKGFLKIYIYTELKENIKNFFLNCENVIFKENGYYIELLILY